VALLLFLTDAPAQRRHALERSFPPTLKALYRDPVLMAERSYMAVFQQILEHSVARPSQVTGLAYPKVSKKFYTQVHEILSGARPAAEALTTLEAELQQIRQRSAW
jgi:trehalose/maltose transport system substrate-binding protein